MSAIKTKEAVKTQQQNHWVLEITLCAAITSSTSRIDKFYWCKRKTANSFSYH